MASKMARPAVNKTTVNAIQDFMRSAVWVFGSNEIFGVSFDFLIFYRARDAVAAREGALSTATGMLADMGSSWEGSVMLYASITGNIPIYFAFGCNKHRKNCECCPMSLLIVR